MKIRTVRDLNIRYGKPNTEAPLKGIIYEGFEIEVAGKIEGERLEGNDIWYYDAEDNYYWSGGASEIDQREGSPDIPFPSRPVNWNGRIQWNPAQPGALPESWESTEGEGVKIAVLDTGIFLGHPDLSHLDRDRMADFSDSEFGYEDRDLVSHGTQLVGLINANSARGVTGVAPKSELYIGKVTHENFSHSVETVSKGIEWAIGNGVDLINMSLEIRDDDRSRLEEAVRRASDSGIIMVASAGNKRTLVNEAIHYPAMYDEVISVGTVDEAFLDANEQPIHPQVNLLLPYTRMLSCCSESGDYYREARGVSMSTAFVSGVIALIISFLRRNGEAYTRETIKEHLLNYAFDYSRSIGLSGENIKMIRINHDD